MPKIKFDVHPGVAMVKKWTDELPVKTGRTLQEWAEFVRMRGPADAKACRAWLKETHGLGTNTAYWIEQYSKDAATWDGDPKVYLKQAEGYVKAMFGKGKEWQQPVFEAVYAEVRKLGKDVKVCPCKTMIPFYRRREFAHAKPATKTRFELALALVDLPFKGRLKRTRVRMPRIASNT
ncbi:MAG: DUF5655 domain-containing protein [Gemmataceae bacterium]